MTPDRKRQLFAAGAGLLAALLAWAWLAALERRLLHRGETLRLVAARRYIPAQTRLAMGDLRWVEMPRAYASTGVITDPGSLVGLQTLVPFSPDEPFILNKLAAGEQSLAASVPEGQRAVSLAVNAVSGVSGLLKPGDHVDVLLLHGQAAAAKAGLLLQDAPVLAVGGRVGRDETEHTERASTVTLALSPNDAALALAASANGELVLILRAGDDDRPAGASAGFDDALRRLAQSPSRMAVPPGADFIPSKR